jgi:hypothetical protein
MREIYAALIDTLIPAFLDHKIGTNTHGNVLYPCRMIMLLDLDVIKK